MAVAMAASPGRNGVLAKDHKSYLRGTRLQRRHRAPCFVVNLSDDTTYEDKLTYKCFTTARIFEKEARHG